MKTKQLFTLFYLKKSRMNKQGLCPIRCRMTYTSSRKEFATGNFISPDDWNSDKQRATPSSEKNIQTNTQLSLIETKLNQAFLFLQVQEEDLSAQDIYDQYLGVPAKIKNTVL